MKADPDEDRTTDVFVVVHLLTGLTPEYLATLPFEWVLNAAAQAERACNHALFFPPVYVPNTSELLN